MAQIPYAPSEALVERNKTMNTLSKHVSAVTKLMQDVDNSLERFGQVRTEKDLRFAVDVITNELGRLDKLVESFKPDESISDHGRSTQRVEEMLRAIASLRLAALLHIDAVEEQVKQYKRAFEVAHASNS